MIDPQVGELWHDRYRLQRLLGGGASLVFLAKDERSGDDVVVKILRPELMHAESAFSAWLTDARVRARLVGPTPAVRDIRFSPLPYSVSDVAKGETLLARLQRGGLLDDALGVKAATELASVLEALAKAGVGAADPDPTNWHLDPPAYVDCGDVALAVDVEARSRGVVDLPQLRRDLGELLFAACTGRDAFGRWQERLRQEGVVVPQAPTIVELRPELGTVSPLVDALIAGRSIPVTPLACAVRPLPPVPAAWMAAFAEPRNRADVVLERPADPLVIDALCHHLAASGADVVRLSPVSRVAILGMTHPSKVPPGGLEQWLRMHALAGDSAYLIDEDFAPEHTPNHEAWVRVRRPG